VGLEGQAMGFAIPVRSEQHFGAFFTQLNIDNLHEVLCLHSVVSRSVHAASPLSRNFESRSPTRRMTSTPRSISVCPTLHYPRRPTSSYACQCSNLHLSARRNISNYIFNSYSGKLGACRMSLEITQQAEERAGSVQPEHRVCREGVWIGCGPHG